MVSLLDSLAGKKNATGAQALDRTDSRGPDKFDRLDENISGADIELTEDQLRKIDVTAAAITVEDARYPEHLESMTGL